jgi:hypothetical protein
MYKDISTVAVMVSILLFLAAFAGLGLSGLGYTNSNSTETNQKVWYCIEGKIYEKFGEHYVTVVPARTCLPVSND